MRRPAVGDIVYPHASPVQAGLVVAVEPRTHSVGGVAYRRQIMACTVRQPNGVERVFGELELKDFRALIADHRRKLQTHEARLAAIEAMAAASPKRA